MYTLILPIITQTVDVIVLRQQLNEHGMQVVKCSAASEMDDHFATIDMGRKLGEMCPFFLGGGELGPHLTQCGLGRGLHPY